MGQQQGNEDEGIFGPLVQANGAEPTFQYGGAVFKGGDRGDFGAAEQSSQGRVRVGDHRLVAGGEDGGVRAGVADVTEAVAEGAAEGGELIATGEVGGAVRGEYTGEDAEVGGDPLCQSPISGGCEVDGAAPGGFDAEVVQQGLVVREVFYVQGDG